MDFFPSFCVNPACSKDYDIVDHKRIEHGSGDGIFKNF